MNNDQSVSLETSRNQHYKVIKSQLSSSPFGGTLDLHVSQKSLRTKLRYKDQNFQKASNFFTTIGEDNRRREPVYILFTDNRPNSRIIFNFQIRIKYLSDRMISVFCVLTLFTLSRIWVLICSNKI